MSVFGLAVMVKVVIVVVGGWDLVVYSGHGGLFTMDCSSEGVYGMFGRRLTVKNGEFRGRGSMSLFIYTFLLQHRQYTYPAAS